MTDGTLNLYVTTGFKTLESNEQDSFDYATLLIYLGFKLICSFIIVAYCPKVIVSVFFLLKLHTGSTPNLLKDGSRIKSEQLSFDLSAKFLLNWIII